VPGPKQAGDELDQMPVAANEEVCRDMEAPQTLVIRMRIGIQIVRKKLCDTSSTKLAWRKTDRVNHHKFDRLPNWPGITVRRGDALRRFGPAAGIYSIFQWPFLADTVLAQGQTSPSVRVLRSTLAAPCGNAEHEM